ncbi:putative uncharacterized protein DDB_G0282133 [Macrobrachium nipponense]|uniref:putative uncharacterized protein DDB_G0282133 n=1 Tax=Macrobrachium nipponense TaxID=159736 RepID=UPI0030C82ECA
MCRIVKLICGAVLMNLWLAVSTSSLTARNLSSNSHLLMILNGTSSTSLQWLKTNQSGNESQPGYKNRGVNLMIQIEDSSQQNIPRNIEESGTAYVRQNENFSKTLSILAPEDRQFSVQNNNRFSSNNNQIINGANTQIVGNSPNSAIQMVQSYVENMINRQGGDRPGYIMINSPNPAIISQLTEVLTQHYGTSSVIRESGAIQNFLTNAPNAGVMGTDTQGTTNSLLSSNSMPVFPHAPYNSRRTSNVSSAQARPSHTDYITQQLSAIADISVSSGTLINDTLSHQSTKQFQTPETPVIHFTKGNTQYLNTSDISNEFPNTVNTDHSKGENNLEENVIIDANHSFKDSSLNNSKLHIASAPPENSHSEEFNNSFMYNMSYSANLTSTNRSQIKNNSEIYPLGAPFSTTGYEDYYEEIDGEIVLSPTKFMRKAGPLHVGDLSEYEYYSHEDEDQSENHQIGTSSNKTKQDLTKWTQANNTSPDGNNEETSKDKTINTFTLLNNDQVSNIQGNYTTLQFSSETTPVLSNTEQAYYNSNGHKRVSNDTLSSSSYEGNQTTNLLNGHSGSLNIYSQTTPSTQLHFIQQKNNTNSEKPHDQTIQSDNSSIDLVTMGLPYKQSGSALETNVNNNYSQNKVESPSMEFSANKVLDYLVKMNHKDLKVLGISENMKDVVTYLNARDDTEVKNVTYKSDSYRLHNSTLSNTKDDHTQVRPNFSPGHFRQSDVSQQQVPPNFFPVRPSQHSSLHHHEHGHNAGSLPELTEEQQQIISRLPVGMQHVVTSIVQAVQVPLQTTTTPSSTSPQYPVPFPYPYPYPAYPYYPPLGHPYPPFQPLTTTGPPLNIHGNNHPPSQNNHHSLNSNTGNHAHNHHHIHNSHVNHHDEHDSHHAHLFNHSTHENHGHHASQGHEGHHPTHIDHINQQNRNHQGSNTSHINHGGHINRITQRFNNTSDTNHDITHFNNPSDAQNHHSTLSANSSSPVTTNPTISETSTPHNVPSSYFTFGPAVNPIISQSRVGEVDESPPNENRDRNGPVFYAAGVPGNQNQRPSNGQRCSQTGMSGGSCHNRLSLGGSPASPDRNQGLLQLRQDASHMGNGQQANSGIVNFRPPAQNSMQMGSPVLNVVLPEIATPSTTSEPGPLIDPNPPETTTEQQVNEAPNAMNRQEMNSLLQSLFSSPTLLLLGIVFATSAAYMAIAMEEQAAQQRFQQAQLAAAFGGQPFPPGRKRRNIHTDDYFSKNRFPLINKIL